MNNGIAKRIRKEIYDDMVTRNEKRYNEKLKISKKGWKKVTLENASELRQKYKQAKKQYKEDKIKRS